MARNYDSRKRTLVTGGLKNAVIVGRVGARGD
jgi:hypothetical protein